MDPLFFGDYPSSMRSIVGSRLPKFSKYEANLVKGSLDFVGINHYTTYYAMYIPNVTNLFHDYISDSAALALRKLTHQILIDKFLKYNFDLLIEGFLFVHYFSIQSQKKHNNWGQGKFLKREPLYTHIHTSSDSYYKTFIIKSYLQIKIVN